MRIFDTHLWAWQAKAIKKLMIGICANWTTVLQRLYNKDSGITANKFRESLSNHLWKVDMETIVHKKAKMLINKTKKYKWIRNILVGDWSDIFKPHAQAMQWIWTVRDWSTWRIWNWYVIYGININGITHQVDIKDPSQECIWSEKRENMLRRSAEIVDPQKTICVFDRLHDSIEFIDMLQSLDYHFIIRGKKNRKVTLEGWKEVKVNDLWLGKHRVKLELWTYAYVYIIQWSGKHPIILYSDINFDTLEECLEIYKKRWRIELDYAKMKSFWLEHVRLMKLKKVVNIMRIIQFIIMLWQDIYNEIISSLDKIPMKLALVYKEYCRKTRKTLNPSSLLSFFSQHISWIKFYKPSQVPPFTLFWSRFMMKKVGLI